MTVEAKWFHELETLEWLWVSPDRKTSELENLTIYLSSQVRKFKTPGATSTVLEFKRSGEKVWKNGSVLRLLAAILKDPSSIPIIYIAAHIPL